MGAVYLRRHMKTRKDVSATRYVLEAGAVLLLASLLALVIALHVTRPPVQYGREEMTGATTTVSARVEAVIAETHGTDDGGQATVSQDLALRVLSDGPYRGETIDAQYNGMGPSVELVRFREGSRALVMITEVPALPAGNGETAQGPEATRVLYQVADHIRLTPLAIITAAFALVTVAVGRWQGVRALIGLALSGVFVGGFILPQILAHRDPVLVTLIGAGLLVGATLYLIQGWNVIGHTALIGMLISLAVTGLLAVVLTRMTFLTGFGSEETLFLQAAGVRIDMRGLLLAGIILGTAGVLDDVVLAQAVTVFELASARPRASFRDLMTSGMRIGVSHLSSMVNTLILAYASTALPLFILFYLFPEPWYLTVNRALIAEEILRTLVGSTGLMLAVPLTTAIAAWMAPQLNDPRPGPS